MATSDQELAATPLDQTSKSILGSTFASLSEHDFAWFFGSSFAYFMGMQMLVILFGYLSFDLTGSAQAIGLVISAGTLPTLFAAPVSGALIDRLNKKTILALVQACLFGGCVLLALLILTDVVKLWHLIVMALILGTCISLNMPTRQSLVPQLVPRHRLMNAISLQMGAMNLSRIVAPALAGLLVAPIGVGWVFVVSAALFLLATVLELKLPKHGMVGHQSRERFTHEVTEGIRYVLQNETVRLLLLASILVPLLAFPVQMMLPVFAKEVFDKGAAGLGLLAAMTGIGGLAGAVVSANLDRVAEKGRLLMVGGCGAAVFYVFFALSPAFEVALVLLAVASMGQMMFMTTNNTVIQATVPGELRGRVVALVAMSIGLAPLGLFPATVAADSIGAPITVAISSLLMLAILGLIFGFSPRLRKLRLDALAEAKLSPAQAEAMVAEGKISADEAMRLTGGGAD